MYRTYRNQKRDCFAAGFCRYANAKLGSHLHNLYAVKHRINSLSFSLKSKELHATLKDWHHTHTWLGPFLCRWLWLCGKFGSRKAGKMKSFLCRFLSATKHNNPLNVFKLQHPAEELNTQAVKHIRVLLNVSDSLYVYFTQGNSTLQLSFNVKSLLPDGCDPKAPPTCSNTSAFSSSCVAVLAWEQHSVQAGLCFTPWLADAGACWCLVTQTTVIRDWASMGTAIPREITAVTSWRRGGTQRLVLSWSLREIHHTQWSSIGLASLGWNSGLFEK